MRCYASGEVVGPSRRSKSQRLQGADRGKGAAGDRGSRQPLRGAGDPRHRVQHLEGCKKAELLERSSMSAFLGLGREAKKGVVK